MHSSGVLMVTAAAVACVAGALSHAFSLSASPKDAAKNGGAPSAAGQDGGKISDVDAKLSELPSLKNFGAKCDGVTDDTAAIKRAVDTVCGAGTGGTLVIPRGTCLISPSQTTGKTFTIYSKCIIIGYGNESILKVKDNAGNYGAIFGHDAAQTYAENFTFANFKIDQNA